MDNFPQLIKLIRKSAGMTQVEFAAKLDVSPMLIAMIETGKKDVSKKFIVRLADVLDVHPSTITPFLFIVENEKLEPVSDLEKMFVRWGERMQKHLIEKKAKNLKGNV